MAIAHDATSAPTPVSTTATSQTWSHTCTGTDLYLKVGVSIDGSTTVSSVTYNGVSLTQLGVADDGTANTRSEVWRLVAPATGAHNVVVTLAAAAKFHCAASSYTGVHQTTPTGTVATATGNTQLATVDVSSAAGELVVDNVSKSNSTEGPTVGAGQTQRYNDVTTGGGVATNNWAAGSEEAGAGTVTMSWSWSGNNRRWATVAVPLKPVVAAPSGAAHLLGGKIMHGSIMRGGLTG